MGLVHRSVTAKLVITTSAITIGLIFISTMILAYNTSSLLRSQSESELERLSNQSAAVLNEFQEARKIYMLSLASNPIVESIVNTPKMAGLFVPSLNHAIEKVVANEDWFHNLILISDGEVIYDYAQEFSQPKALDNAGPLIKKLQTADEEGMYFYPWKEENGRSSFLTFVKKSVSTGTASTNLIMVLDLGKAHSRIFSGLNISAQFGIAMFSRLEGQEALEVSSSNNDAKYNKEIVSLLQKHSAQSNQKLINNDLMGKVQLTKKSDIGTVAFVSLAEIQSTLERQILISLGVGGLASIGGVCFIILISLQLVKPVKELTEKVRQLSLGDLDAQVHINSEDEIGILSKDFNSMARELKKSRDSLRERIEDVEFLRLASSELMNIRDFTTLESFMRTQLTRILEGTSFTLVLGADEVLALPQDGNYGYQRMIQRPRTGSFHGYVVTPPDKPGQHLNERQHNLLEMISQSCELAVDSICALDESVRLAGLELEVQTANVIQESLFPTSMPTFPGWDVTAFSIPATQVGGDWYGIYHDFEPNIARFYVGDVTGHGIPAALMTAAVMATVETTEFEIRQRKDRFDPVRLLENLNNTVLKVGNGNMLMTFFLCEIELDSGRIRFVNAAHIHPFLMFEAESIQEKAGPTGEEKKIPRRPPSRHLVSMGSLLGVRNRKPDSVQEGIIPEGAIFVLHTDGLIEAQDKNGEVYGINRLKRACFPALNAKCHEMKSLIINDFNTFRGEVPLDDDLTCMIIKRNRKEHRNAIPA